MQKKNTFLWSDGSFFYNTLTKEKSKKPLPIISCNKKSVDSKLFSDPSTLQLTLIPTWSCNLRCPHCFVIKKLNKNFNSEDTQIENLKSFIIWHQKKYNHKKLNAVVIGGEPLLYPDICLDYIKLIKSFDSSCSMTTNLSLPINEKSLKIFELLDQSQISIDGPEEVHNDTRFVYLNTSNPTPSDCNLFEQIIKNLKILKTHGFHKKLHIAISIRKDLEKTRSLSELKMILKALEIENVTVGYIAESSYFNKTKEKKFISMREMAKPCCSYRYMRHFVIQSNKIYGNYFDKSESSFLGDLTNNFEELPEKYKKYIEQNMPILKDETCLNCSALPICWGQCVGHGLFDDLTPSQLCNQKEMIEKMNNLLCKKEYLETFDLNEKNT